MTTAGLPVRRLVVAAFVIVLGGGVAEASEPVLGDEQSNERGGFAFRPISGYQTTSKFAMTSMDAPEAQPKVGPSVMMMGWLRPEATTLEAHHALMTKDPEEAMVFSEPRKATVGGAEALVADVSGKVGETAVAGRIVAVLVTPNHVFSMIGVAPQNRWSGAFSRGFDAVLASVRFFEPKQD